MSGPAADPKPPALDEDGFAVGSRPLCPFCSKAWSAKMMEMFEECSVATGYYGDPEEVELTIDITCDGCDRLIYRKEIVDARTKHGKGYRHDWDLRRKGEAT